jgi:uncharacterized protein (TIGR01777 family)
MRIVVSGASGFIGRALVKALDDHGHDVVRLVRRPPERPNEVAWNPDKGEIDTRGMGECHAVIHLAGENIAGRWTREKMDRIRESRAKGTRLLATSMGRVGTKPNVFISASATGIYGNRPGELLTEHSKPGEWFLAEVCKEWEAASWPAAQHGLRVANLRFGMVLSRDGGALAKMLPAFRMWLAGVLGKGHQYMPWITIDDAVAAILYVISNETLAGPINVVAPEAATNEQFTDTLARVLHRRALFNVPPFVLRLAFGQMADEVLLSSANVVPQRLIEAGFRFKWPQLESALEYLLK